MARGGVGQYNIIGREVDQDGSAQAVKNEFARRLQTRYADRGWNQSDLAREASKFLPKPMRGQKQGKRIGRDQISHYTRGVSLPRPDVLRALAKALGCEPADLMPGAVPSTAMPATPFRITSLPDGRVRLVVDRPISMKKAMDIVRIMETEKAS